MPGTPGSSARCAAKDISWPRKSRPSRAPMRVLPHSLFGRLVLVLSVGLTVALVGSAAINLRERHHLLEHAGAERFAQRIATTTGLIDRLAPADRQQLVRVMSSPRSSLAISPSPELLPSNRPLPQHLV